MADQVKDEGKTAGQVGDKGQTIDPAELQNIKASYDNLNSLLGKQGNELGQLRQQLLEANERLVQSESEKEMAATRAAESSKVKEFDTAVRDINGQISQIQEQITELDVTDPAFTKNLTKLQKQQTDLQGKAFHLAEQKGREETLAMAKDSFSKELSKRDQVSEERAVQKVIENFNKQHPDFQEANDSGALDKYIEASDGFDDPVSAYWRMKHDQVSTKLADMEKRLALASGETKTGTVITSSGHEIQQKPKEKLGEDRLNPQKVDAGMKAVLQQMRSGAP